MMNILRRLISKFAQNRLTHFLSSYPELGKVYMIHDVVANEEQAGEFAITVDDMVRMADYLSKKHAIRLEDWDKEKDFVALSADDVAQGFYQYAFPILKKRSLPFTIFVNVGMLNKEGYITETQLLEMARYPGCTVGSHGMNHVYYNPLSRAEYESEIKDSKEYLQKILGKAPEIFAYPYGSMFACGKCDTEVVGKEYSAAFSTINCGVTEAAAKARYFLPRINVSGKNLAKIIRS